MFRYDKKRAALKPPPPQPPENGGTSLGVSDAHCGAVLATPFKAGPKGLQLDGCIRMASRTSAVNYGAASENEH